MEEKIFTSGSGAKFNYTFVPALTNKLYLSYMEKLGRLTPLIDVYKDLVSTNKKRKELFLDEKKIEDFNKKGLEIKELSEQANKDVQDLILLVLRKNKQDMTVEQLLEEMSDEDLNEFARLCIN
jgi:hypothetical protein